MGFFCGFLTQRRKEIPGLFSEMQRGGAVSILQVSMFLVSGFNVLPQRREGFLGFWIKTQREFRFQ